MKRYLYLYAQKICLIFDELSKMKTNKNYFVISQSMHVCTTPPLTSYAFTKPMYRAQKLNMYVKLQYGV